MNDENDHDYFACEVRDETPRALLVKLDRTKAEHWVPRSLCEVKKNPSGQTILEVEAWFAKKEGLGEG